MSFRATTLRRSYLVAFLLGLLAVPSAVAQLKDPTTGKLIAPIAFTNQDAIVTSFVTAPNNGTSAPGPSEDQQWLQVEIHYGTTTALKQNFLDSVEFKIWVEGRDLLAKNTAGTTQGAAVGLTTSISYVNVPASSDLYAVFFIPPATLKRYSTSQGVTDFDRKFNIHAQALVGGVLMDEIDKRKDPMGAKWYTLLTPISGMIYQQNQSPFIAVNADRYPPIKLPAAASAP